MTTETLVPLLMFATLGAVFVMGAIQLLAFLRKRRNRDAATRAFYGSDAAPGDDGSKAPPAKGPPLPSASPRN